ncbi:fatty acid synthase-like [Linepithema humile]|uniref:fatty acid synthase-like n=1 Tax=Linepithema humile TaxID=83485 RepID=UPI00351F5C42
MLTKLSIGERMVEIARNDEEYEYMSGHVIDGRQLLPATGYLMLVWQTMGLLKSLSYTDMPIFFENVKFIRVTHFPKEGPVYLIIKVQKATGKFEVIEGDNAVVTGTVREPTDITEEKLPKQLLNEEEVMNTKDIYKKLRLRGYQYAGIFRGYKSSSTTGKQGHIAWMYNWVTFMDNMLQMTIFGIDTRSLHVPTGIQKLVIDTKLHIQQIRNAAANDYQLPVRVYKTCDAIVSGGVEIRGIKATSIFRRKPVGEPVLEEYRFIAHRDGAEVSLQEAVMLSTHLALEYHQVIKFVLELNKCTNTTWDEKLEIFLKHVSSAYSQVMIDKRKALCTTMYKHLIGLHEYDETQVPKIESPIILLKPTTYSLLFPQEDYGLHKTTNGKIEIHYVEGTHMTIIDNEKIVAAINETINSIKPIKKLM